MKLYLVVLSQLRNNHMSENWEEHEANITDFIWYFKALLWKDWGKTTEHIIHQSQSPEQDWNNQNIKNQCQLKKNKVGENRERSIAIQMFHN